MSIDPACRLTPRPIALVATALCVASLALFWPGVAMYDTVAQYKQVLSGVYDDWHPPAMARAWALLAPLGSAATPMLVLQLGTYWLGLGLIAAALARAGRSRSAVAIIVIGLLPPFLGWQGVVLKDAQLTGALLGACGIIGWYRLSHRPMPRALWVPTALLLAYAVLVRANAVFIVVPLVVTLAPRPAGTVAKIITGLIAVVVVLGVAPVVNHQILRAQRSGVESTQALFDLAGIAARVPDGTAIGLTRAEADAVVARHCASPFFWDPLGDDAHCGTTMARLRALPVGTLYLTLAGSALHHPIAYAAHRFAHLNSTDRWLVPFHWPSAAPDHVGAQHGRSRQPERRRQALGKPDRHDRRDAAGLADQLDRDRDHRAGDRPVASPRSGPRSSPRSCHGAARLRARPGSELRGPQHRVGPALSPVADDRDRGGGGFAGRSRAAPTHRPRRYRHTAAGTG
ncbi:hypothetical protein [Sphingomonas sp. LR55]|uniref:hypothetical protein n=1 Tax=Sphingomonas sp. LR55 TaxID=3050231 RepID=UPI002FE2A6CE